MTNLAGALLLLCYVTYGESMRVTEWCKYDDMMLNGGRSSGRHVYTDMDTAKEECLERSDCFGLTKVVVGHVAKYRLRKGWELMESNHAYGRDSYVPCAGYFKCQTFGLKSADGKYLRAREDGTLTWDSDEYGDFEQVTFEQYGRNSGFLKSFHGKYLAATTDHQLQWNREWRRSWEKFTVYENNDNPDELKVAFKSIHGRYLSAHPDGSVDVDGEELNSWKWFTVYPTNCLKPRMD